MTELDAVEGGQTSDAVDQESQPQIPQEFQQLQEVLDAHGLNSADDLQGMVENLNQFKKGYGDSQNEVGELRRQVQALQQQQAQIESQQRQADVDPYEEKPINLKQEIQSAVGELIQGLQYQQLEGQRRYLMEMGRLESQPNWTAIKPAFEKAMQQPEVQRAIQQGATDMEKVYLYLNQNYLLGVAGNAQKVVQSIPDSARRVLATAPDQKGDGRVAQPPSQAQERRDNINKAKENLDAQGVLQSLIPDGDPITNPN